MGGYRGIANSYFCRLLATLISRCRSSEKMCTKNFRTTDMIYLEQQNPHALMFNLFVDQRMRVASGYIAAAR